MTYTAIDIPFIKGQDESYDKKVLPVGPLRRVENAYQERTGRMVERRGMQKRISIELDRNFLSDYVYQNSIKNDRVVARDQDGSAGALYSTAANRTGGQLMGESDGSCASWGYQGKYRANTQSDGAPDTFSPAIAVMDNVLLFAFVSADTDGSPVLGQSSIPNNQGRANVFVYDIRTMRLIRKITWAPQTDARLVEIKIAANRHSQRFAVGLRVLEGAQASTTLHHIELYHFGDEREDPVFVEALECWLNTGSKYIVNFDMTATRDDDYLVMCYRDTSGNTILRSRQLAPGLPDGTLEVHTGGANNPASRQYIGCNAIDKASMFGVSDAGGQLYLMGFNVDNTHSYSGTTNTCPCVSIRPDNRYMIAWGAGRNTLVRTYTNPVNFHQSGTIMNSFPAADGIPHESPDHFGWVPVREYPRNGVFQEDRNNASTQTIGVEVTLTGTTALVRPAFTGSSEVEPSGVIARALSSWRWRERNPGHCVEWLDPVTKQSHRFVPLEDYLNIGQPYIDKGTIFEVPVDPKWKAQASFIRMDHETSPNNLDSESWDNLATVVAGAALMIADDQKYHFAGFTGAPFVSAKASVAPDVHMLGTYNYIAVCEYVDESGRTWRSVPSTPYTVTVGDEELPEWRVEPCAGFPRGAEIVVYRTVKDGSTFYRVDKLAAAVNLAVNDSSRRDQNYDDALTQNEILYTQGGVVANDPPPAGRFITRTRSRFWVGLLDYSARVQASKFLRPTEGIHWSDRDNFFVDVPEAVTALSSMDEVLIIFSLDHIYLVHGEGPNDQGLGAFGTPQLIPSDVGCVDARSIVVAGPGIFFLSRRGMELLNRGFAQTTFIGDAVRDVIEAHPFCLGSEVLQTDKQVRWLMSDGEQLPGQSSVVVVYDLRVGAWSIYSYPESDEEYRGMGRVIADENGELVPQFPRDGVSLYQELIGNSRQEVAGKDASTSIVATWETGELRPAGMNAGAYGRRINILGTFISDCDVTITLSYDDKKEWSTKWTKTWKLRDTGQYSEGSPVQLELTLPQQKFFSIRFKLEAVRLKPTNDGFQAHGITAFFDTEGEGPRLGAGSKG